MHLNPTWAICTLSQEKGRCWLSQLPVLTENPQTLAGVRMCTVHGNTSQEVNLQQAYAS